MSIEENNASPDISDDLDLFSADFFGQKKPETGPSNPEDDSQTPDADAPERIEDTPSSPEDDASDSDDGTDVKADEQPKKKNRFQERIDEVVGKQRETERKLADALAELERLKTTEKPTEPIQTKKELGVVGPNPTDKNDDGSDKYPLGEFDPSYIRDLAKHTIQEERKAFLEFQEQQQQEAAQKAEQQRQLEERQKLEEGWNQKLVPALERYPDFQDKGQAFVESVNQKVDPTYAEYLTNILMNLEYGPDVFYHLANNPDEAMAIIASGPHKAPAALGRLEAKFAFAAEEKQNARPKVSQAPEPPAHRTKGNSAAVPDIPADTDDLDKFEKAFFNKKK